MDEDDPGTGNVKSVFGGDKQVDNDGECVAAKEGREGKKLGEVAEAQLHGNDAYDSKSEVQVDGGVELMPVSGRDAITARNAVESPLLRLPNELKDKIWELTIGECVVGNRRLDVWCDYIEGIVYDELCGSEALPSSRHEWNLFSDMKYTTGLLILRTICRQTRAEATNLAYRTGVFHFRFGWDFRDVLHNMPRARLESIRNIALGGEFEFSLDWYYEPDPSDDKKVRNSGGELPPNLKRVFLPSKSIPGSFWNRKSSLDSSDFYSSPSYSPTEVREIFGVNNDRKLGIEVVVFPDLYHLRGCTVMAPKQILYL